MHDTIWETFLGTERRFGDKRALICLGETWSYSELKELAERLAASLHRLGVRKGERVVLYLYNIPQFIISWLALQRLGCVVMPISPVYTASDIKYMINDSGAETIICMDTNFGYVDEVRTETCLKRIVVTTFIEMLPWWKKAMGISFDVVPTGRYSRGEKNILSFGELIRKVAGSSPGPYEDVQGEDTALILYTGGTLGFPKGVPYSNAFFLQNQVFQRQLNEQYIPKGEDMIPVAVGLFHLAGESICFAALLSGDAVILFPRVHIDAFLDHVQRYKATTFGGVPTLYRMILEHDRVDYYDLSSVQYWFSGAEVLPIELAERWRKKFGKPLYQLYANTESYFISGVRMGEEAPLGSIGKVVPAKKIKIVDPDTMEPVMPGEPGELLLSSDLMVRGYWNKPEETARCFVEKDGRLWYRTGDIIKRDEEGWLFFVDRNADVIKHKGYRVAAAEIETVLQEHQAVIAACVVGVPDEKVGERIKAFVILKSDVRSVSTYELAKWCRDRLAPYKVPQYIEFRDMLPKSKAGKLLRREIRAEERRKASNGGKQS